VLAIGLLLIGCGDGSAGTTDAPSAAGALPGFVPGGTPEGPMSGSMPGMAGAASLVASASPVPVAAGAVTIQNFAFNPAALTVKVGTAVTWTNKDAEPHTVSSPDGPLHSPTLQTGAVFTYTFTTPGSYHYLCTIHPFMTATVTVTP
jgi:plastocyanin